MCIWSFDADKIIFDRITFFYKLSHFAQLFVLQGKEFV